MSRRSAAATTALLIVSSILAMHSWSQLPEKPTKPPVPAPEKPNVRPIKFPAGIERIRAKAYLGSIALRGKNCPPAPAKEPGALGIGGFGCETAYRIDLAVHGNRVDVTPSQLRGVRPGDCIQWVANSDDEHPATITSINFFDTVEEAQAAGKSEASAFRLGADMCTDGSQSCVVFVALADGWYRYTAKVKHNGMQKKADPDIVVECGSGCGDPHDMNH